MLRGVFLTIINQYDCEYLSNKKRLQKVIMTTTLVLHKSCMDLGFVLK